MRRADPADQLSPILAAVWSRDGRKSGAEISFMCPAHRDQHPSARFNSEKAAWYCPVCNSGGGWRDLSQRLGLELQRNAFPRRTFANPARAANTNLPAREWAVLTWRETQPATGTLAEQYLATRRISGPLPPTLRFHPRLWHGPAQVHLPALIAAVTVWPSSQVSAVHRTYLGPDRPAKASVVPVRMALGAVRGGAVRLAPAGEALALAEGIETALSVQQAVGCPAWATLGASFLPSVVLPILPLAREVFICADPDPAGRRAAQDAAARWSAQGRRCRIAVPPTGCDFNDLLCEVP